MKVSLVGQSMIKHPIMAVHRDRLSPLQTLLTGSDVAFTNLETTILGRHGGWPMVGSSLTPVRRAIYSPPEVLDELKVLGFNALSLSNNHAFSLGPGGILSTLEEVAARGFLAAGIGADLTAAATPGRATINGHPVSLVAMDAGPLPATVYAADAQSHLAARPGNNPMRVTPIVEVTDAQFAMVAEMRRALGHTDLRAEYIKASDSEADGTISLSAVLYPGAPTLNFRRGEACRTAYQVNRTELDRNLAAIRAEKAAGSFVIVYVHHHVWDKVWEHTPSWMQSVSHEFVEAGADIVVSHGVPVLHGVEIYRGKPIFYSLGNFIFHPFAGPQEWVSERIWLSVVATCCYDGGKLERIEFVPVAAGGQESLQHASFEERDAPGLASGHYAERTLVWLKELSHPFGSQIEIKGERAVLVPSQVYRTGEMR
jgi:poly-gamma-glutamate capsule biosynthesis protein CapA/YwtB (metallophosphatase superfamily)